MTNFVNLTPHNINLNDGTVFPKSGTVAGVGEQNGEFVDGIRQDSLSGITGLPDPVEGTIFIVSMPTLMGLRAMGSERKDVVTPITRGEGVVKHPKEGFIISVPGLRTF